jgi:hypothetical protein
MAIVYGSSTEEEVIADGAEASITCCAIYVGSGGDISISRDGGTTDVVFYGVPTGSVLQVGSKSGQPFMVNSSANGTTATKLVALSW